MLQYCYCCRVVAVIHVTPGIRWKMVKPMKRRNWRKLAICSWQLGSKDCVLVRISWHFRVSKLSQWLLDYSMTQYSHSEGCPEISSSSNLHRCTVHHESTDFPLMKLWECQGSRVDFLWNMQSDRDERFSRMIIIHHHSIFLFPTPSRCVLASAETFHFAKKGAAEPRAIGPIHRADQRTDAGTPSADQAGQNIAWTHLVAPLRVSITAVGCRFRKRLKVAQRKAHFATFHQCHGKMHQGNIWNGGIP